DAVLDERLVDQAEHLLGHGLGGGKEASAQTCGRKNCFADSLKSHFVRGDLSLACGSIVAGWPECNWLQLQMRDGLDGFYGFENHAVPDVGNAAGADEFDVGEAGFAESLSESFA